MLPGFQIVCLECDTLKAREEKSEKKEWRREERRGKEMGRGCMEDRKVEIIIADEETR